MEEDLVFASTQRPSQFIQRHLIGCTFSPSRQWGSWDNICMYSQNHPIYLKYSTLNHLSKDKEISKRYLVDTLNTTIDTFDDMPNLVCLMLCKIS